MEQETSFQGQVFFSVLHCNRELLAIRVGAHTCRKEAAAFGFGDVGQE